MCDVTSTAQVDALISSTTARMGRLDVLVNNAGLGGQTPVVDMTDEEWDRVLNVTLTSVMRATRAALRYFRDAGPRRRHRQQRQRAGLAGAAFAVALRRGQGGRDGADPVQRNRSRRARRADQRGVAEHRAAQVPGEDELSSELLDRLSAGEAFGRAAEPWEVAATIAFLASDYSSYLTGEVISVSSQRA